MAVSPDLIQLLREIRNVASPGQRVRLLARGWRSLRRLSRTELQQLAGQLGFDGAEELLRRLARGKGRVETRFLENVLEHVREPDDVKGYIAALRDPEQRKALLRKGLDAVSDELQPAEPPPQEATETPAEPAAPTPEEQPAAAGPSVAVAAIPVAAAASVASAAKVPTRPPTPPVETTRPVIASPEEATTPLPPARPAAPQPARAARPAEEVSLAEDVGHAPTLIERFRRLNGGLEQARRMDLDQLRALLELFPDDWRRRRALCALLRERIPKDLLQAMFLVEGLASTAAERWCVATILHSWDLTDEERLALRERHGLTPRRSR